jgi:superfamily II DNA/RNA helicase
MNLAVLCVWLAISMLRVYSFRALAAARFLSTRIYSQAAGSVGEIDASVAAKLRAKLAKSLRVDVRRALPEPKPAPVATKSPLAVASFGELGLDEDIMAALEAQGGTGGVYNEALFINRSLPFLVLIGIHTPTPVQKAVIPRILKEENLVMAASTGSGKTLAYMLPCLQSMHIQEKDGYVRKPKRPRCLVLVPTRELARQVLDCVKQIGHYSKVSSTAVLGGEQYGTQKKQVGATHCYCSWHDSCLPSFRPVQLDRLVDVVVASPGRLMEHKKQGNVYLSQVTHVIIDEVDTMLTQGFGPDIRAILRSVIARDSLHDHDAAAPKPDRDTKRGKDTAQAKQEISSAIPLSKPVVPSAATHEVILDAPKQPAQLIMATATLTKAVRTLLTDVQGGFNLDFAGAG